MSYISLFTEMLNSGYTMDEINRRIKLYNKYGLIPNTEKIEIYATLLHDGYFTESNLDTYITQGYITSQDKADIIALEATY